MEVQWFRVNPNFSFYMLSSGHIIHTHSVSSGFYAYGSQTFPGKPYKYYKLVSINWPPSLQEKDWMTTRSCSWNHTDAVVVRHNKWQKKKLCFFSGSRGNNIPRQKKKLSRLTVTSVVMWESCNKAGPVMFLIIHLPTVWSIFLIKTLKLPYMFLSHHIWNYSSGRFVCI